MRLRNPCLTCVFCFSSNAGSPGSSVDPLDTLVEDEDVEHVPSNSDNEEDEFLVTLKKRRRKDDSDDESSQRTLEVLLEQREGEETSCNCGQRHQSLGVNVRGPCPCKLPNVSCHAKCEWVRCCNGKPLPKEFFAVKDPNEADIEVVLKEILIIIKKNKNLVRIDY